MGTKAEIISLNPFEDSRGTLKKILMQSQLKEGNIEEVYLIYTSKGRVRGNHYHKTTLEYFTVVSGTALISLRNIGMEAQEELIITAEDNVVLKVPPGVAHAFKNQGEEPLVILAVSTREYDKLDTDTFPLDLL